MRDGDFRLSPHDLTASSRPTRIVPEVRRRLVALVACDHVQPAEQAVSRPTHSSRRAACPRSRSTAFIPCLRPRAQGPEGAPTAGSTTGFGEPTSASIVTRGVVPQTTSPAFLGACYPRAPDGQRGAAAVSAHSTARPHGGLGTASITANVPCTGHSSTWASMQPEGARRRTVRLHGAADREARHRP